MPEMSPRAKTLLTSAPYRVIARKVLLPWVLQGERPTGEGLEIGAGSGAMTARLLAAFPDLRMIATDYDPDMVTSASRTLSPFGDRATAERADATDLPYADARFGLVLSAAMLHHVGRWEAAVAEALRVLRPGGVLIGFDILDIAPFRLMHRSPDDPVRILRRGELESRLHDLPATDVRVRASTAGVMVRFTARRPG
jgi:ubiquinone/menaquinone biosynthesis C-methylase UbiE